MPDCLNWSPLLHSSIPCKYLNKVALLMRHHSSHSRPFFLAHWRMERWLLRATHPVALLWPCRTPRPIHTYSLSPIGEWRGGHCEQHAKSPCPRDTCSLSLQAGEMVISSSNNILFSGPVATILTCPLEAGDMATKTHPSSSHSLSTTAKLEVVRTWLLFHMCVQK